MNNNNDIENIDQNLFEKLDINYSKSKEDVWAELSKKIETKPKSRVVQFSFKKMSIAASVAAILGVGLFFNLYTKNVISKKGMHLSHLLPDGSKIELNANSKITYKPFWWYFKRTLTFEGEGFFEVQKGSNFAVVSEKGTTEVLGTSFNISTKNNMYAVFCKTGKVRVTNNLNSDKVVLTPNMYAILDSKFDVNENIDSKDITSWINNEFKFSSSPLETVLNELEIQYDVEIKIDESLIKNYNYTGFFKKQNSPEATIKLICSTFDFTFEKQGNKKFNIVKSKQSEAN